MSKYSPVVLLLCSSIIGFSASAQDDPGAAKEPSTAEADHEQLRALRDALTEAVRKGDTDAQLVHVDENVVTTWQNNRVARGHDGLREFLKNADGGGGRVFQGYTEPPTADELTILHGGDTGIVFGKSVPHYKYMGMEFDLKNRWTATLIKNDKGDWKIAAYHVSADVTDNPLLNVAKQGVYWASGLSLVIGLLVGVVGSRLLGRKRKPE